MGIKKYTPYTPSRRNMTGLDFTEITKNAPEKSLTVSLKKNSGRNNQGKITVRFYVGVENKQKRSLISSATRITFLQPFFLSSTIRTEQLISLLSATQMVRRLTS